MTKEELIEEIKRLKANVDRVAVSPSREKAMVHTKLDEALLWLSAVQL